MPSSLTKLNVWNLALDLIREAPLQSAEEPGTASRWLSRNWDHTVETTLRSYVWSFAKEFFSLPADAVKPPFKWSYRYKLPPGLLRVLPITESGERLGRPVPHELAAGYVYTDYAPPLRLIGIMDRSNNPGLWDALFVEIVRCSLAIGMANKFTGKAQYLDRAEKLLKAAQAKAEEIEAYEGTPEPNEQFDILRARGETYSGRGWR